MFVATTLSSRKKEEKKEVEEKKVLVEAPASDTEMPFRFGTVFNGADGAGGATFLARCSDPAHHSRWLCKCPSLADTEEMAQ